ncbi:MAG: response regulator transcription factor [Bacteroidetes bacterium]|nr:response regulator transcription factor [Bacteroidota bacterium]MCW5895146.1 response regulator transcription factor [Bacteroidota bacterium]
MAKILVVEDEPTMQIGLRDNLEFEGYDVNVVNNGKSGLEELINNSYDLVVLDVMLPQMSGFDVLKKAREKGIGTPVIMLTAKGEEIDKVLGLELGADDYMTKPFSLRELIARVKAVLRRQQSGAQALSVQMKLGDAAIDFAAYTATRDGKEVAMTPKEFEILKFLWQHRNTVVSRDQLLTNVWGYDESISTRTVDNFVLKLRQKLEADPSHPRHIITIHGTGYKLIV